MKTGKALVAGSREARHPQERKAGAVAKPAPKTEEEAHQAIVAALCGSDTEAGTSLGVDLFALEDSWPKTYKSTAMRLANIGLLLGCGLEEGSQYTRNAAETVMAYRRRIIKELEIKSAAEYMLLDAAMDAYIHWLQVSALARASFADGTTDSKAKFQARLGGAWPRAT